MGKMMGKMKDLAIQQEETEARMGGTLTFSQEEVVLEIASRDCPQPGCRGDGFYLDLHAAPMEYKSCPICTQVGEKLREVARLMAHDPSWTQAYEALFM